METIRELTPAHIKVMKAVRNGADVWGYQDARLLREIERAFPEYITICKAMNAPKNGAAQQPYFGAILTKAGRKAIAHPATAMPK